MRPDEAAALYLWAVGDGRRGCPDTPEEMARVGRGLQALIDIAGGHLLKEPVDLGDGDDTGVQIVKLGRPADGQPLDPRRDECVGVGVAGPLCPQCAVAEHERDADPVVFAMGRDEARAVLESISVAVQLLDEVGAEPDAPLYGQTDRLIAVAHRLDHEINHA